MRPALALLLTILISFVPLQAEEIQVYPKFLLTLDSFFSHHVIVAEKSTHRLYIYQNDSGIPKLIKTYQMATGKKAGNKFFQGDHRTPEGIYNFTDFLTHQDLLTRHGKQGEIYGVGAFVLNYPNPMDDKLGKTGGGIWLHSTNDETRIEKGLDSRGCIVTANSDLIDIARYIELHRTPIVVVHEVNFLSKVRWEKKRQKLIDTIESWAKAWQEEDFDSYISSYHNEFYDASKGSLSNFRTYKKAVFAGPGKPEVKISNLSVLQAGNYITATFKQEYNSNTIKDIGKKTLYLKRDEYYNWKIVSEKWTKSGVEDAESVEQLASFEPSQRFFESTNPKAILGDRLLNPSRNFSSSDKEESNN